MGSNGRRIALGSDMSHETVSAIARHLDALGFLVVRCGAVDAADTPWPEVADEVARLVASGGVEAGVVCCWTGTGVSIAANKVPGVRAALCADQETARGARRWNDANVLAIRLATSDAAVAAEIVDAFLETREIDPSEAANIARVTAMEQRYCAPGGLPAGGDATL